METVVFLNFDFSLLTVCLLFERVLGLIILEVYISLLHELERFVHVGELKD